VASDGEFFVEWVLSLYARPHTATSAFGLRSSTSRRSVRTAQSRRRRLFSTHALTTTTFLMRWPSNSSVANPPGQATLQTLKTASGGVQYLPVGGAPQTELKVSDVITISKTLSYTTGMSITIADGQTVLWTGTL